MAERDDMVVTVGKEMARKDDWVVTIKDELQRMDTIRTAEKQHWDKRSIYRVPASVVTELNMKAYQPQFVSFGPYHHGEDHLKPMEVHKHRALLHFLKRSCTPLESYLNALAKVAQSLKDSYDSLNLDWERDTNRFLQMMILDGCFMLEVLRNNTQTTDQKNTQTMNDYLPNDPIFSTHGKLHIVPYIKRDMLMLENQLPMLLLTTLLDEETKCLYLINLIFDVRDEFSIERLRPSNIIDSAKDVSLLQDKGIIKNALGSDKAVAELFNTISKDATLDPASSLNRVHETVDKYCKQRCNKWRANAKHTYFRNPWAIISVIAAFVLFTLTILQTIYTMLSYYDPLS
ncbi:hypothetical protein RHMOL_Rhmol12G0138500 [Rhododendron molle]|uniref:Uncharacterized protein n=1 Tax=Rhododendron molle TaxID=49168 RepID=A0ACC0LI49_RHOML|nr:hypothetical protein RHMOL_Rhmol12G0138500 [Rhododendron molle]